MSRSPWWQRLAPLLGLFLLCLVLSLASPHFLTVDNLLNVLRQSAINAILALGQLVVIITAGIDLSIGSVVGLTIVVLTLLMRHGVPVLLAAAVALALGTAIGLINGLLLTRLRLPHPFISTLGTLNVARGTPPASSSAAPRATLSVPSVEMKGWGSRSRVRRRPFTRPIRVPTPPKKLAPPMMTAAMASSSAPVPANGNPEFMRAARTMAASPAEAPLRA